MRRRSLAHDRRGAAAVEFACCATVFMLMLFGIIDAGRLYLAQHALDFGVARAVRAAVVNGSHAATPTAICSVAIKTFQKSVAPALGTLSPTVTLTPADSTTGEVCTLSSTLTADTGSAVAVAASYQWTPVTPLMPASITLSASSSGTVQD